ncbi:hypothetical protein IWW34DRAFT_890979 [Fusarium oxysporum f. sp. albedinis]|nr:hypothetical protein IWW34DRAFT_890979 [Fusarium oxysporum f. sp. albedinis]
MPVFRACTGSTLDKKDPQSLSKPHIIGYPIDYTLRGLNVGREKAQGNEKVSYDGHLIITGTHDCCCANHFAVDISDQFTGAIQINKARFKGRVILVVNPRTPVVD